MIAGIYCRVSTQEQALEGYSINEQEKRLKDYCSAKNWNVYKTYIDPGYSGSNINRPALQKMISDIAERKIDIVLVYKLDRLSRSQKDTMFILEDIFLKNNVNFVSMNESFDTTSSFGRAMIGMLSVFAQLERENIKERTSMGRQARIEEGHPHCTTPPLGYNFKDNSNDLIIEPYGAMLVKKVYDLFLKEAYSINKINSYMHESYGDSDLYKWINNTSVRRILSNPVYAGKIKYGDKIYDGIHDPIIDMVDFERAQTYLKKNKTSINFDNDYTKDGYITHYLLSGLLYCGDCGARLSPRTISNKTKRYVCYSVSKASKAMIKSDNCTNRYNKLTIEETDNLVLNEIKKLSIEKDYFNNVASEYKSEDSSLIIKNRLSEIDSKINKLLDLYQQDFLDIEEIKDRLNSFRSEKNVLEQTLCNSMTSAPMELEKAWNNLQMFKNALEEGTKDQIQRLVHSLINKIVILNDEITIYWSFN